MPLRKQIDHVFEHVEDAVYILIALLLVTISLFLIWNSIITIAEYGHAESFILWIVEILDRVLLLLMVIEIMYTVRVSFREHSLKPQPFLIVGLIAAIRRIMVISVESAYLPDKFDMHMIEIGILGVLILIFVVCVFMLARRERAKPAAAGS